MYIVKFELRFSILMLLFFSSCVKTEKVKKPIVIVQECQAKALTFDGNDFTGDIVGRWQYLNNSIKYISDADCSEGSSFNPINLNIYVVEITKEGEIFTYKNDSLIKTNIVTKHISYPDDFVHSNYLNLNCSKNACKFDVYWWNGNKIMFSDYPFFQLDTIINKTIKGDYGFKAI